MDEYVTTTEGGGHTVVVRQCPLCTRISPHAHGFMGLHDGQPFCDRCMDDLAMLIKARRNALHEGVSAELMRGMWPVGVLYHGPVPPLFSLPEWQWRARDDLGPQVWERIA